MEFNLKTALEQYTPNNDIEKENLLKIKKFLDTETNCFSRSNLKGHITASALVIDEKCNILLNHHKSLNKWLNFGGHRGLVYIKRGK